MSYCVDISWHTALKGAELYTTVSKQVNNILHHCFIKLLSISNHLLTDALIIDLNHVNPKDLVKFLPSFNKIFMDLSAQFS